jgi:DNA-binding HxlR family transcriptional regulator
MTKVKESSTRNANKQYALSECPVTYFMNKISGHWKPIIIYHLLPGPKRYSEIRKAIPAITEKMLIQHLKQLENDKIIVRRSKPVVPPYVVYSLSESGRELAPVLEAMGKWAIKEGDLLIKDDSGMMNLPK